MTLVGIDLGTTHSLVSLFKDGRAQLIPNSLGELLTPSVVSVDADGSILVGRAARDRLITHPAATQAGFKRYMGGRKTFQLGKRKFLPEELSSFVLRSLKSDAEAFLGGPVDEAVISVPAYFNDAQRKATKAAGQLAGFKVDRLINEPTAAAVAYGLPNVDKETTFLVFDLGGGTFDVSILELFDGTMEVHAASGDNFLGGEDFDQVLADGFLAARGLSAAELDAGTLGKLKRRAERCKIRLGEEKTATLALEVDGKTLEWTIDRDGFEALAKPLLQRLRSPVERALRDSRLNPSDLDSVILVGGSTRIPFVRSLVARMFGRIPSTHLNPDEVVGLGAGIMAAMKSRHEDLREVVMTDVCPYSLGVAVAKTLGDGSWQAGHFLPIIERNATVPVSRSQIVNPTQERQKEIVVAVYQGESRLVQNNVELGKLKVPLPAGTQEEQAVEIRFTYDINGLLEVEALVLKSGSRFSVVIEENPGVLSKEEIAKRFLDLAEIKIHPRDQMENRTLLAHADRLFEESLGQAREALGNEIALFSHLVEKQEPNALQEGRVRLATHLQALEQEGGLP